MNTALYTGPLGREGIRSSGLICNPVTGQVEIDGLNVYLMGKLRVYQDMFWVGGSATSDVRTAVTQTRISCFYVNVFSTSMGPEVNSRPEALHQRS